MKENTKNERIKCLNEIKEEDEIVKGNIKIK